MPKASEYQETPETAEQWSGRDTFPLPERRKFPREVERPVRRMLSHLGNAFSSILIDEKQLELQADIEHRLDILNGYQESGLRLEEVNENVAYLLMLLNKSTDLARTQMGWKGFIVGFALFFNKRLLTVPKNQLIGFGLKNQLTGFSPLFSFWISQGLYRSFCTIRRNEFRKEAVQKFAALINKWYRAEEAEGLIKSSRSLRATEPG